MLIPISLAIVGFTFFISVLLAFYIYRRCFCHNVFRKLGIPGPEPHWLYGNLHELWATENRHLVIQNWARKYGKFFGYYEGSVPILVTSSAEAIERLCVKQFNSFPGRKISPVQPNPHKYPDSPFANIGSVWGERWKRLRTITNPGFSTGKLKCYSPLIAKSQVQLMELLNEFAHSSKSFNIDEQFQYLTLDIISNIGFGIELNSIKHRGVDNPILPKFKRLLQAFVNEPMMMMIASCLPEIVPLIERIIVIQMSFFVGVLAPFRGLAQVCAKVVATRKSNPSSRRNDLLQMLIDASNPETTAQLQTPPLKPLSDNEIISQSIQFFGAGYGTTSATLSYAAYCLAKHQDCQEKLYNEVMYHFPKMETAVDYDTVMNQLPYLDWFIHETIRLFPIALYVVNRFSIESTQLCGVPIPKRKMLCLVDMWTVHQDPELWGPVDPACFYPERFSPAYQTTSSRPGSAFLGFGYGPRHCLGMRLALYEMKLTIVELIRRFQVLEADSNCPYRELSLQVTRLMMPKNGVWVRLAARNDNKTQQNGL